MKCRYTSTFTTMGMLMQAEVTRWDAICVASCFDAVLLACFLSLLGNDESSFSLDIKLAVNIVCR